MYTYAGWFQAQQYGIDANLPQSYINASSVSGSPEAAMRNQYLQIARKITPLINKGLGFGFVPYSNTLHFDADKNDAIREYGTILALRGNPMMQLTGVTLGDGTALTVDTQVRGTPRGVTPITALQILPDYGYWTQYTDNYIDAIAITGLWGYRTFFATDGFISSGDAVANPSQINATQQNLIVTDTNGADIAGYAPRFDIGQVLKIESEYVIVTGVDYTTNVLTILRGQLGTTAATHANGTTIYTFQVEPPIVEAASMITAYEMKRRNNFSTVVRSETGFAVTAFPSTWPEMAIEILDNYRMVYVGSIK